MSRMLQPLSVVLLLVVALAVGYVLGAGAFAADPPTLPPRTPTPPPSLRPTPADSAVVASAVVVPSRSAQLALPISGRVERIFVEPDQQVGEDQLLLRLDGSARQAAVRVARADVRRAEAAVERALALIELLPQDASQAQVDSAQAELRLAQAELDVAQSALAEAEVALAQSELRAPFEGTVVAVDISEGEQAAAGQVVVTLADTSTWLFQTTDLSELQVVRVSVGDRATIRLEALPDLELSGTVSRIQIRGTPEGPGVRFDVIVRPDEQPEEVRWSMRATVRILPSN